jgi:hypothetical protein
MLLNEFFDEIEEQLQQTQAKWCQKALIKTNQCEQNSSKQKYIFSPMRRLCEENLYWPLIQAYVPQ